MTLAVALALALAAAPCAAQEGPWGLRGTGRAEVPAGAAFSVQNETEQVLLGASSGYGSCAATFKAPYWPNSQNNCLWTGRCCDPSMTCYVKQPSLFAACMPSCTPGTHYWEPIFFWYPWRCDVVPGSAPAPTPAPTPPLAPAPAGPSNAETFTFYMYRAQSSSDYPPKNVNTANLQGVMWYLVHEVMITTPPKFNIARVLRYKVETKAPQRIADAGMNFGVRYAYDSQACTGPGDCDTQYNHWGYFVGCNNLGNFPYPKFDTHFPGGVWYSLPGAGECSAPPTGDFGCTYSYEPEGEVSLEEISQAATQAGVNGIWSETANTTANLEKAAILRSLFKSKYPDSPDELANPPCDFNQGAFYPNGCC